MKCPDCGSRLSEVMVEKKLTHRCFKCGGFWADSETINRMTNQTMLTWRRIKIAENWLSGGSGLCPQDGTRLEKYQGESIPSTMVVKRCIRCGKWWFAGDTLYEFKPVPEVKVNYASMLLPIMTLVILSGGMVVGLQLVKNRQQVQINAAAGVRNWTAIYLAGGREEITFTSALPVTQIQYRKAGAGVWQTMTVTGQQQVYIADLTGLEANATYEVNVLGTMYTFVTKSY